MEGELRYYADIDIGSDECHGLVRVHCAEDADHQTFMRASAERWSVRSGWFNCRNFQLDLVHGGGDITRDYGSIPAERVEAAMWSMRAWHAKPVEPWDYWKPSLQLALWFVTCLDAIEAGVITAEEIPPESGLNGDVVAALKAVETWDLSDEWEWTNTPVTKRGDYPILLAHQALAKQCRAVERRKTHCPAGHEYTDENTRREVSGRGLVRRHCRECDRHRYAARKASADSQS
jgi:hypothetical protein